MSPARLREATPPALLALFLFAGTVKDTPLLRALPVDLTLLAAVAVLLALSHRLLRPGARVPSAWLVVLVVWLTFVPGVAVVSFAGEDGAKSVDLFTLTLLAALAAPVLLREEREVVVFAAALVALGVVVAGASIAFPDSRALASQKYAVDGATTIEVARVLGAAAIVCLLAAATRRITPLLGVPIALAFLASMVLTGSRGPVVAAVLGAAVVFVLRPSRVSRVVRALGFVAAVGVVAGVVALVAGDQFAVQRALTVVGGSGEGSSEVRGELATAVLGLIPHHPFGIGWGRLAEHLPPSVPANPVTGQWAHNVMLEAFVESGWAAGVAVTVVIVLGLAALLRSADTFAGAALAALAVFAVTNAMVSGTVNDNRFMIALIVVGLGVRYGDVVLGGPTGRSPTPLTPAGRGAAR